MSLYRTIIDAPGATDRDSIHRLLGTGWVGTYDRANVLWALTRNGIIVQSTIPPNNPDWTATTQDISDMYREGDLVSFRCLTNPVKHLTGSTKYVPITGDDEHYEWFIERLSGVEINDLGYEDLPSNKVRGFSVSTTVYDGTFTMTDLDAFMGTLVSGIGRSKAWGYGLLLGKVVKR